MVKNLFSERPSWIWMLVAAPLLFLLQVGYFAYQLERTQDIVTGAIYLPAGLLAVFGLIYALRASDSTIQERNTWIGYLIGIPFAFIGSLVAQFYLGPWLGSTLGGAVPWLLFTWVAYKLPHHVI